MTSRRQLLSAVTALTSSGLFVDTVFASAKEPVAGKDYTIVRPPLDFGAKPIVIHDFFAYTCPHCLSFAPQMERYAQSIKAQDDVRVVPVPVAWNESYEIFPRTYFSFIALGLIERLHHPFWEWTLKEEHDWKTPADIEQDITAWVVKNGVNSETWHRTISSFTVVNKTKQATMLWKNYGVDSTPTVGVAGRFLTAPNLVGTRQGTIDVLKTLVERVKAEK